MGLNPSGRAEPGGRRWFFQLDGRTCSVVTMIPLSTGRKATEGFARGLPEPGWAGGMGISPTSVSPSEQGQPQTWARSILGACCCFSPGFETRAMSPRCHRCGRCGARGVATPRRVPSRARPAAEGQTDAQGLCWLSDVTHCHPEHQGRENSSLPPCSQIAGAHLAHTPGNPHEPAGKHPPEP